MSERDEFDSASEYVNLSDLVGELLLLSPTEYIPLDENDPESGVNTAFGRKDAIITDIAVISQGTEYDQVMILQGGLIGTLKRKLPVPAEFKGTDAQGNRVMTEPKPGRKLLGVLGKGEARKGQNAPYILIAPDDAQKQAARDFLAGKKVAAATAPEAPAEDDPFAVKK